MSEALTKDRILDAAGEVLRRFGPQKATVVDVARALGVSHGSVYRHFRTKAALRDAVTERWLSPVSERLAAVVRERRPALQRLGQWFHLLITSKRKRALEEPGLFATYTQLAMGARGAVKAHVDALTGQLTQIITEGVLRGEFAVRDPAAAARAIFNATSWFHNPIHAPEWSQPGSEVRFQELFSLLLRGLGVKHTAQDPPAGRRKRR